ncbi:MAG TPA: hypothetical protein VFU78_23335 [Thermomicrobiales bacterium]|nr:hypothetical protein [Thermomicrobiales bacterium]
MSAAPAGFTTQLTSEVRDESVGATTASVRTTYWELTWPPVAGATDYVVFFHTSEGASQEPTAVPAPCVRLSVARTLAGDTASNLVANLALTASHLAVSVAARFPDGTLGPVSPLFPVGLTALERSPS